MTCMPASRKARATTLMPRSWPSSPTLARTMRRGGRLAIVFLNASGLPFRRPVIAAENIRQGFHDLADGATDLGGFQQARHQVFLTGCDSANLGQGTLDGLGVALLLHLPEAGELLLFHALVDDQRFERFLFRLLKGIDADYKL